MKLNASSSLLFVSMHFCYNTYMLSDLQKDVAALRNEEKGLFLMRFFKTGKGQYGEGDVFYGLTVPQSRKIVVKYKTLPLTDVEKLLESKVHEERLIALLILVTQFAKADESTRKKVYEFYLAHTKYINNWDLVDLSADKIVGEYLKDKDRSILKKLAKSDLIWDRRISMIATFQFIKDLQQSKDTFLVADILLTDKHDLIQKAVGWMLREVGKRVSEKDEVTFLATRYQKMPRTMLRYAIERFPEETRLKYLSGEIKEEK
jgi:3-methyladenine DNA glycosylase AlkD